MRITRNQSVDVDFDVEDHGNRTLIYANNVAILEFTSDGYMRRLKADVESTIGLRRLPDGRVAIKPKKQA